jgi:hypothetical protein
VNFFFVISYELDASTGWNSEVSAETEGIFRHLMWPVEGKVRRTRGKIPLINGGNIRLIYNKTTLKLLCICSDVSTVIYNKSLSPMFEDYGLLL